MRDAAAVAEMGWKLRLERRRQPRDRPSTYGLKAVIFLDTYGPDAAEAYLDLNGHRLGRATRRFWLSWDGQPVSGWKQASPGGRDCRRWVASQVRSL